MKKTFFLFCLTIISYIFITCSQSSQDQSSDTWPNFRGVNGSGIASPKQNPPVNFGPEQNVIWKIALPEGHSSPCIWGKNIFITGFDEEKKLLKMFCIDRKKGKIKWEKNISVDNFEKTNPLSNPATATPATDGERVYFYFSSYGLLCYDNKGELIWELQIPLPKSRHGMGTSPVITDNLLILNCLGHQNDPRILAINKIDGSTVWKYSLQKEKYSGDSYSTPVIYKNQVIVYASENVSGYDLKTGDRKWNFDIGVTDAVCTPVMVNDILFTTSHSTYGNPEMRAQFPDFKKITKKYDINKDLKLDTIEVKDYLIMVYPEKPELSDTVSMADAFSLWDKNNDKFIDSLEWKEVDKYFASFYEKQGLRAIRLGGEGNISINSLIWDNPEQVPHVSSPLFYNNHVYMIRDGGIISCFQAETGKLLYRGKSGATGAYFASPVAANGMIYIASRNGIVTIIGAEDTLKIISRNNLGDIITATPALVNNNLYLRTNKTLYAFGKR
jgi:outer membrane protein assembly factor BamB